MKKLIFFTMLIMVFSQLLHSQSKVYFTSQISGEAVKKIFDRVDREIEGKVGIKVHFGEEGNQNYLRPHLIKDLTLALDADLIETNVLYVSKRRYTESHIQLAKDHGFDFAPINIIDSEGELLIPVNSKHYEKVKVGKQIDDYQTLVIFSHFKGHMMTGCGGAIKNVAMGLASIPGKMALHASAIPRYSPDRCIDCKLCVSECPVDAITLNPLVIDADKCIGCGSCIGVCPVSAFNVPWGSTSKKVFLERLVEYAKGIVEYKKNVIFINVIANVSTHCDCSSRAPEPFMKDVGILASTDIVAIEKASYDLVDEHYGSEDTFLEVNRVSGRKQIDYAHKLGLGNKDYILIDIEEE